MEGTLRRPLSNAAVVAGLATGFLLLSAGIAGRGLMETSEGRYGSIAAEMARSGDYLVPRINGVKRFEKPPLAIWAMASSIALLGESEGALRLPGAIAGTLTLLVAFAMAGGRREPGAAWAPLLLLASPLHFVIAKVLTTDIYLALFSATALWLRGRALDEPERAGRHVALAAVATGLGFMTKGPVILVLVVLPALLEAATSRAWGDLRRMLAPLPVALFLLVAAPWFVAVSLKHPGLASWFLTKRSVGMLASSRGFHAGPLFYYLPVLLVGLLPGIAILLLGGRATVAELWRVRRHRLLVLAIAVPLAVFTASVSKLATYVLPLAAPASVLAAAVLHGGTGKRGALAASAGLLAVGGAGLASRGLLVTPFGEPLAAPAVRALTAAFAILVLGGAVGLAATRRRGAGTGTGLLVGVQLAALLLVSGAVRSVEDDVGSGRAVATTAARLAGTDVPIICYRSFLRSLPFYTGRRVIVSNWYAKERLDEAEWEAVGADARVNLAELAKGRVVVVTERQWTPEALRVMPGLDVVMTRGELVLLARPEPAP